MRRFLFAVALGIVGLLTPFVLRDRASAIVTTALTGILTGIAATIALLETRPLGPATSTVLRSVLVTAGFGLILIGGPIGGMPVVYAGAALILAVGVESIIRRFRNPPPTTSNRSVP